MAEVNHDSTAKQSLDYRFFKETCQLSEKALQESSNLIRLIHEAASHLHLTNSKMYQVFLLKVDPSKLGGVSALEWLLILLKNSESLSLNQFSKNLEFLGKKNPRISAYWNLFLLICNFEKILYFRFSLTEKSSERCLHIDSNTFVILELMFYLFLKRSVSEEFSQQVQIKFKGKFSCTPFYFSVSSID